MTPRTIGEDDPRPPVPLDILVRHVCDDGADYNDSLGGWCGAVVDETGRLTMVFHPDPDAETLEDSDYGPTLIHFRVVGQ